MKITDEEIRKAFLSAGTLNVIQEWGKDKLRDEYIEAVVEIVKLRNELSALKESKIILPQ